MKRVSACTVIILWWGATAQARTSQEVFSRSFMYTRPGYDHLSMESDLWYYLIYTKSRPAKAAVQIVPFMQRSLPLEKTTRYFLINGQDALLVAGDAEYRDLPTRNVRAEYLNLPSTFRGVLSVNPLQRQTGFYVQYNQDLSKWCGDTFFFKNWYLNIRMPVLAVDNDWNLTQTDIANPGATTTQPQDILQAFSQPAWVYSRYEGLATKVNVGEIKVALGTVFRADEFTHLGAFSSLVIPTGNKQDGKFIFEPYVGNNRHVGLAGAVHMQFLINEDPNVVAICFFVDLEGTFLVRNKQERTFDLRGKEWSRFLLFNFEDGPPNQNIPGVNLLTRRALVRTYGIADFSTGWRFVGKNIQGEICYNLWGHDQERIEIRDPIRRPFGIAAVQPLTDPIAATASTATISTIPVTDMANGQPTFIPVTLFDFDERSAAASSALSHKAQASVGIVYGKERIDAFAGLGAFIDIPQKNGSLRNWGIWGKIGASF
ncbi:MAG TPA: hypothetical protein VEK38_04575 [Candidatus Bathyarchaeia archaeon]|nr:hypothetical protein [Candidatus Bathyarchaeia archaeon]